MGGVSKWSAGRAPRMTEPFCWRRSVVWGPWPKRNETAGAGAKSFLQRTLLFDYSELFIQALVCMSVHVTSVTMERRVWLRPVLWTVTCSGKGTLGLSHM